MPTLPPEKGPLSQADYARAAAGLGIEVRALRAFAEVESRGDGWLATGEPKILYERHVFRRLTAGKWDGRLLKSVHNRFASLSDPHPGGYGPLSLQHRKLEAAALLNRQAALQACSWGLFQVMGESWRLCGYENVQDLVNAAYRSTAAHLDMFCRFCRGKDPDLLPAIREHRWADAATLYNGTKAVQNGYDRLLREAYEALSAAGPITAP